MKRPGPFGSGEEPTEPEDDAALVLARDLDRREEEDDQEDGDDGDDDECDGHQALSFGCADPTTRLRSSSTASTVTCSPGRAARRRRPCPPELAADEDPAVAAHDALVPDELPHADLDGCARAARRGRAPPRAGARAWRRSRRRPERDLVRLAGGVEQDQRADHERDRPGERERAVAHDERLGDEEPRSEQHQQEPGRRDGQHLESVEADDERDRAHRPGEDEAGVPQLDDDPEEPEGEHQRDHVRVDQHVESTLPEGHLDPLDLGAGRVEHESLGDGAPAVDLLEEGGQGRRDHVDHVQLHASRAP